MTVLVRDTGFTTDDWSPRFFAFGDLQTLNPMEMTALAIDLPNDVDVAEVQPWLDHIDMIRLAFPSSTDGRAFSQASRLRLMGFSGRLRAAGHVLADQYAMARRSGFDEVEISGSLARRMPEPYWLARANWQQNDYQTRLRQFDR